jgi:hypothetical protein
LNGEGYSLIDQDLQLSVFSPELAKQVQELIEKIRKPILDKFKPQISLLENICSMRYENVTLPDLADESQAVYVLADCIEVRRLMEPLRVRSGDISEASLGKRIEMLKKRLDQPVLGIATPEMRNKVKECNFINHIVWKESIKGRLWDVINEIQKPQEAANEQN